MLVTVATAVATALSSAVEVSHAQAQLRRAVPTLNGCVLTNPVRTRLDRLEDIAWVLRRDPQEIALCFHCLTGMSVRSSTRGFTMRGSYNNEELRCLLQRYIRQCVQCVGCQMLDTFFHLADDGQVYQICRQCVCAYSCNMDHMMIRQIKRRLASAE
eukprot:gene10729-11912_t